MIIRIYPLGKQHTLPCLLLSTHLVQVGHIYDSLHNDNTAKCRVNAHGHLHGFDPKKGDGHWLGAGNFLCTVIANGHILHNTLYMHAKCVVIAHGRTHLLTALSVQSTGTMHVPFLSRSEHKRLGARLLRTTINLCRTLGRKRGVGGCYAVGVYSALYGDTKVDSEGFS